MTLLKFMPRPERILIAAVSIALLLAAVSPAPADAHAIRDETPRIAVVSAFAPELAILQGALEGAKSQSVNGVAFTTGALEGRDVVLFLSGISVVNAAMTVQLALDHFAIERIVFSGIAGGVDGERLHQRREFQHHRTHLAADGGILLHVGPDDGRVGTALQRLEHRHRRAHAVRASSARCRPG